MESSRRSSALSLRGWSAGLDFHIIVEDSQDWNSSGANPIADIQRAIYAMDRAALNVLDDMRSHDPRMDAILALRRLPMTDKRVFIEQDPEPAGRRYGPYDADPHTKGRRRRFSNQRRT